MQNPCHTLPKALLACGNVQGTRVLYKPLCVTKVQHFPTSHADRVQSRDPKASPSRARRNRTRSEGARWYGLLHYHVEQNVENKDQGSRVDG